MSFRVRHFKIEVVKAMFNTLLMAVLVCSRVPPWRCLRSLVCELTAHTHMHTHTQCSALPFTMWLKSPFSSVMNKLLPHTLALRRLPWLRQALAVSKSGWITQWKHHVMRQRSNLKRRKSERGARSSQVLFQYFAPLILFSQGDKTVCYWWRCCRTQCGKWFQTCLGRREGRFVSLE